MVSASAARHDAQPGYVLHAYPYRETSLIVEVFTRDCGRVALVARGARRARSALRGVLMAFQPLLLSWAGKSELHTLVRAEWVGGVPQLSGAGLLCGFYVNELLLRLLARDDPHEQLYRDYEQVVADLAGAGTPHDRGAHEAVLRRFERRLLAELGYGLNLEREADGGRLDPAGSYVYVPERGPVPADRVPAAGGVEVRGRTLLDMARDDYGDPVTAQQGKLLMRAVLNHHLGNQPLHTRQLLKDLQQL